MILKNPDSGQGFSGKSGGCRPGEEAIFFSSLIMPEAGEHGDGAGSKQERRGQQPAEKAGEQVSSGKDSMISNSSGDEGAPLDVQAGRGPYKTILLKDRLEAGAG